MTVLTLPSPTLMSWAHKELGPLPTPPVDVSHPRVNSRVWELTRPSRVRVFLKVSPNPVTYQRETFALRHAVPALGAHRAPQLIASHPQHLALLVTAVDGRPIKQLTPSAAEEAEAHRQGGLLLARLHAAGDLTGPRRAEAERALTDAAAGAEDRLTAAGDRLTPDERDLVRACAAHLSQLPPLPLAFIHGDAWPRNLLWNGATAAWIDFERARFTAVVQDLVPLACAVWPGRPDLRAAFFAGYGRTLTASEDAALTCLSALDAVSCLRWGPDHGDPQVTARGRRTLDRLTGEVRR
ncbi:aminoglycoside phosphotransferase family protein [Streptomyces antnestii]|uniref:Aminoglycoside phosphotransferase family protein n=1 Tax=Streptomyces antnestii TaxID=2494256 RepID=A0A3S2VKH3_9ACTN|nr:phosphotransferase [Streptomyces sp. San01]RVU28076.1 aminoglycoside phosphotransferase family protein [Streptomyces sp. San01]